MTTNSNNLWIQKRIFYSNGTWYEEDSCDSFKEKAERLGVPLIPKRKVIPIFPTEPTEPNPVVAVCGECGLELRQVMGYVCSRPNCPTGLGPIMC